MNKKMMLVAALLAGAAMTGTPAQAQPGECSVTGAGTFPCDVVIDGGGFSFSLPDGGVLAFTLSEADQGTVYLLKGDARPGQPPRELKNFAAVPDRPGCWAREDEFEFCAMVLQGEGI